ncbi:MAG: helix-turn-helix transcriptional regulator [Candidatus Cloacimonadota bacterium]|nr:helix-turn-helix transcriptional regulator [Candidatus Cloacimonadota bacterium]
MAKVLYANSKLINKRRKKMNLSKMKLAELCGMSRQNLSQFLLRKHGMLNRNLKKLAKVLDLKVEDLTV